MSRFLRVRSADGQRETLPVSHDETATDILAMLRGWAESASVREVWFVIDGREYRMQLDGEPQEVA